MGFLFLFYDLGAANFKIPTYKAITLLQVDHLLGMEEGDRVYGIED